MTTDMDPAYTKRSDAERAEYVLKDAALRDWWDRSRLPLSKFVRDNRVMIDQSIDYIEERGW